jgi:hypothetical protein
MKKGKVISLVVGILFIITSICFFIAKNNALDTVDRNASSGGYLVYTYTQYAKYFGIAAYSFMIVAIPCLIFGFRKSKKENKV